MNFRRNKPKRQASGWMDRFAGKCCGNSIERYGWGMGALKERESRLEIPESEWEVLNPPPGPWDFDDDDLDIPRSQWEEWAA